jgi:hypothetical protein
VGIRFIQAQQRLNTTKEARNKSLRGQIAALRGAQTLVYPYDIFRVFRSARLALYPARSLISHFLAMSCL